VAPTLKQAAQYIAISLLVMAAMVVMWKVLVFVLRPVLGFIARRVMRDTS
jgi:hypothetical protein